LKALALLSLVLAGCYSPEALDCTVTCNAADECADGQVCGSDGFCAAPAAAGHCGGPDGGVASSLLSLHIAIDGPGKVSIDGVGVCDSDTEQDGCTWSVQTGISLSLKAQAKHDHEFVEWTVGCSGTSSSCALTPVMGLTQVGAKFQ
jgi:hypothetical protein